METSFGVLCKSETTPFPNLRFIELYFPNFSNLILWACVCAPKSASATCQSWTRKAIYRDPRPHRTPGKFLQPLCREPVVLVSVASITWTQGSNQKWARAGSSATMSCPPRLPYKVKGKPDRNPMNVGDKPWVLRDHVVNMQVEEQQIGGFNLSEKNWGFKGWTIHMGLPLKNRVHQMMVSLLNMKPIVWSWGASLYKQKPVSNQQPARCTSHLRVGFDVLTLDIRFFFNMGNRNPRAVSICWEMVSKNLYGFVWN